MRKGIALSGGGARSFVQIGVLKVFEKKGIDFDVVTGTSMGAIIGTIYCFTQNVEQLEEIIFKIFSSKEFKYTENFFSRHREKGYVKRFFDALKDFSLLMMDSFKTGLIDSEKIKEKIYKNLGRKIFFEEAKRTLGIVATDYFTGKIVIFNKGEIISPLIASSAIPGFITPIKIKNSLYIDGGATSLIPVISNAILGGEIIIGIENNTSLSNKFPFNAYEVFVQVEKIKNIYTNLLEGFFADVIFNIELSDVDWFNFSKIKECIKKGEKHAEENFHIFEKILNNPEKLKIRELIIPQFKNYILTESSV